MGYYTSNNSKTDYNTTAAKRFIKDAWDESSGKTGWWNRAKLLESTIIFFYSDHGGGALRSKILGNSLGHQVPMSVIIPPKFRELNPFKD